jgi:SAM-dependent methyltransferase
MARAALAASWLRPGRRLTDDAPGEDAAATVAALKELEREWRRHPVRDDRINEHIKTILRRTGVAGGRVLEIGGRRYPRHTVFEGFQYENMDLVPELASVVGDITRCPQIPDSSYDVVLSVDVFEHVKEPWLAAKEIQRILAPGGVSYTSTLFSWRYHPCPVDFWRFTPDALTFLFNELNVVECNFDVVERRRDMRKKSQRDPMPIDALGGWRENVRVFHAGVKPRTAGYAEPGISEGRPLAHDHA